MVRVERRGVTLIETLVTVGLVAMLLGLLLPAIQQVRSTAARARSQNNLRQIALAVHQYAGSNEGRAGGFVKADPRNYAERDALLAANRAQGNPTNVAIAVIDGWTPGQPFVPGVRPYLLSPADPTAQDFGADRFYLGMIDPATGKVIFSDGGPVSYAFNMVGFLGPVKFPAGVSDGTSNTVAFAERYFECREQTPGKVWGEVPPRSWLMYEVADAAYCDLVPGVLNKLNARRPSFADAGWGDVVPVTDPATHVTRPSRPGATFQVRPRPADADMSLPQTPFAAGLPVALFDGSVRTVRPGVAPEVFWAAVTPAGGEVVSLD